MKKLLLVFIIFFTSQSIPQNFWQQTGLGNGLVRVLAANSQGDIFAGVWSSLGHSAYRLYRSTDNGNSWDSLSFGFPNPAVYSIIFVPKGKEPEEIYTTVERGGSGDTTYDGVYYSFNNGDTWQSRSLLYGIHALITPDSGSSFLASIVSLNVGGYRSFDSCRTWIRITPVYCQDPPIISFAVTRQGSFLAGHIQRCQEPYGILRSTNSGQTWSRHQTWSQFGADVYRFLVPPQGDYFLIANDDGVNRGYYSYDGQLWVNANDGIPPWAAENMNAITMDSSGTMYVGERFWGPSNGGGIFRSTDNGNSWSQWNSGLPYNVDIFSLAVNSQGYIFVGSGISGVFRSAQPVGTVLSTSTAQIIFPQIPVGTIAIDSFTVYSQNSVPLIINNAASTDPAFTVSPDSITITPGDSALFYVRFAPDSVRQYTGEIVLEYNGRLSPDSIFVQGDAVIPVELISFTADVVGNKVELNWSTATETNNSGFEIQRQVGSGQSAVSNWEKIGFVSGHGTTTEPKFYSFTDDLSPTFAEGTVGKLTLRYRLNQIDFDGTFKYSQEQEVDVDFTPNEFVLYQNYPNPFNPSTKIKFTIPKTGSPLQGGARGGLVTLIVYDVLGNEVATLVNEEKEPGVYEIEFNANGHSGEVRNLSSRQTSTLSSGIYFYQLKAGSFIQTKKMIIVR